MNLDEFAAGLKYDSDGLIAAVVQDRENNEVLMVAYMNEEAVKRTLTSGRTCFWSRSRQEYWVKGETSGNTQNVQSVSFDCDSDCLLVKVSQKGAACHKGYRTCFFRTVDAEGSITVTHEQLTESY